MKLTNRLHAFVWESMTANNCNTYLIDGPTRILIDPGHLSLFNHVIKGLAGIGLEIGDIGVVICTHAHPDHIEALQLFKKTSAMIAIHETEWELVKGRKKYIEASFGLSLDAISPDFFLKEGDLSVNGLDFKVIHTPGHTPGSVSLYWPGQQSLFTGDLVFKDGVGRTDLTGGNGEHLKRSIKLLAELDAKRLLPGHGEIISGAEAVRTNFRDIEHYWFKYI